MIYLAEQSENMNWPEAAVVIVVVAFMAFFFWLIFRD